MSCISSEASIVSPAVEPEVVVGQRYRIGELLGQGGMGAVFRAFDTTTKENVAIKLLKSASITQDAAEIERFRREGEALRVLDHPSIVKVLDLFQDGERHYLVMELVEGGSLETMLRTGAPLPIERVLALALDLADALARVHHLDIVHRDIKPANVLIAPDGTPRLSDFGVAIMSGRQRLSASNGIVGTLDYLSPETVTRANVDSRSDIWSFGVLLYEMLTGRRPFDGEHAGATLNAILSATPPDLEQARPDCPTELVDLVYRMLEKDPQRRIPSARRVGAELESITAGKGAASRARAANSDPPIDPYWVGAKSPSQSAAAFAPTAPVHASVSRTSDLPNEATPFIGRERELAELARLLNDPGTQLVTILGPGGMGKSRLAVELARQFRSTSGAFAATSAREPERDVFLVELAPLTQSELVLSSIAEAVGFRFYPGGEPRAQLFAYLGRTRGLLLLDNFEHVLDAASLVGDILKAAPSLKVVTTSRQRLGLAAEHLFLLSGMGFPEDEVGESSHSWSGVRLFAESARRVRGDFALTEQTAVDAARICRLVEGLPLGIVIAASWVNVLEPDEIAAEIEKSFEFLSSELVDMPSRHRSLRAVFDYSFGLLTAGERAVLARLAVFRGGFTRAAAETVAAADLRSLATLMNKSLITRDPESGRFAIHELLRQYAEHALDASGRERDRAVVAHTSYYSAFLRNKSDKLKGARPELAVAEIEPELANVRVAWPTLLTTGQGIHIDEVLDSLGLFHTFRCRFSDADETFTSAALILGEGAPERGTNGARSLARALTWLSQVQQNQWRHSDAVATAARALQLLDEEAEPALFGQALLIWAVASMRTGEASAGLEAAERGLNLYRKAGDDWLTAWALCVMGDSLDWVGTDRAEACFRESIELQRALVGEVVIAAALSRLGGMLAEQGKYQEGVDSMHDALAITERQGDAYGTLSCLQELTSVERKRGNYDAAEAAARRALSLARDAFPFAETWSHAMLAVVLKERGFIEEAESHLRAALLGDHELALAVATLDLGDIALERGEREAGARLLRESLTAFERLRVAWGVVIALDYIGHLACADGRHADAETSFRRALGFAREIRMVPHALNLLAGIARVRARTNERERAVELLTLVHCHPATERQTVTRRVDPLLLELSTSLPPGAFEAATARGRMLELEPLWQELSGGH
jgi:predicted ATPase